MRAKTLIAPVLAMTMAAACTDTGPTEVESAMTAATSQGQSSGVEHATSVVTEFPNGAVIPGAEARLSRGRSGVNVWFDTHGLTPGNAYTLWVVVFNHPDECIQPNACRLADAIADDPAVGVDLLNGAAHVVGASGTGTFAGRVNVGEVGIRGVGLLDAFEPEIHLVVRDHGPKLPGAVQLKQFGGGCGVYACANVQDALHF